MTVYRPTTLRLASRHCPRAVDFYEEGRPYFRDHFATGIAAHAVLEACGRAALDGQPQGPAVDAAVRQLVTAGRTFDGVPEPPLALDAVLQGRDLALAWVESGGTFPAGAHFELGAGFDREWKPAPYSGPDTRFHLIFDVLALVEESDEESARTGVVHRDYKSGWSTDESELDTLQMKAQALAAWTLATGPKRLLGYPEGPPTFIRSEVVNLRTRQTFTREIPMHEGAEGHALLAGWRRDIEIAMDALDEMRARRVATGDVGMPPEIDYRNPSERCDMAVGPCACGAWHKLDEWEERLRNLPGAWEFLRAHAAKRPAVVSGPRPARPGVGCMGCPWVMSCTAAGDFLAESMPAQGPRTCDLGDMAHGAFPGDAQTVAQGFAAAQARRDALKDLAQAAMDESGVIEVPGGVVGTVGKEGREPVDEVGLALLDRWTAGGGEPRGLLKALGDSLGMKSLEAAAKVLHPGRTKPAREERERVMAELTRPAVRREFGVHRVAKDER